MAPSSTADGRCPLSRGITGAARPNVPFTIASGLILGIRPRTKKSSCANSSVQMPSSDRRNGQLRLPRPELRARAPGEAGGSAFPDHTAAMAACVPSCSTIRILSTLSPGPSANILVSRSQPSRPEVQNGSAILAARPEVP